jgi:hypothetical protein
MGDGRRAESIGRADAIITRGIWPRGVGIVLEARALEEMLLLA